ncbi:MAG: hypothetical protein ACI3XZ_09890, partial [Butyricicoccus sp.]
MAQKPQIISFPVDRRARRQAALRAADRRLRVVARLRRIFGWVTAVAFVLFCAANLSLFSRDTLRHMGAWIAAGLSSADAGTIVEYATGNTPMVAAFADSLAVADNDTLNLQK